MVNNILKAKCVAIYNWHIDLEYIYSNKKKLLEEVLSNKSNTEGALVCNATNLAHLVILCKVTAA